MAIEMKKCICNPPYLQQFHIPRGALGQGWGKLEGEETLVTRAPPPMHQPSTAMDTINGPFSPLIVP
jgi:hypothetical protein